MDSRSEENRPSTQGQKVQPSSEVYESSGGHFWSLLLGVALMVVVLLAWGGRAAVNGAKDWYAGRLARQAMEFIGSGDLGKAQGLLVSATQYSADQEDVIRASAEFLIVTKQDPRTVALLIDKLRQNDRASGKDLLKLGHAKLEMGDRDAASMLYQEIPAAERNDREPLELLASIYRSEGRLMDAERTLREALAKEPDNPDCLLRLSLLDYSNSFPEIHRRARERLWLIARGQDDTALRAIHFLAEDKDLSRGEAATLMEVLIAHPDHTDEQRLEVVSASIRVSPQLRDEIMDQEIATIADKGPAEMLPVLRWLHGEKQFGRILKVVPVNLAVKSRELFPIVAQALGEEGRWADLKRLLTSGQPLPISRARMNAWLAEAESHLNPENPEAAHQLIVQAIMSAEQSRDYPALIAAAVVAEKTGSWPLAARACRKVADADPRMQLPMMEKVLEMRTRDRDAPGMLAAARELCQLRPENPAYTSRLNYVRLVSGLEIELAMQAIDDKGGFASTAGTAPGQVPTAFLRALEACRFGDLKRMAEELHSLTDVDRLDAGLRAVHAGMLSMTGQVGMAYELAEQIPAVLLLDEEAAFLARAR